MHCSYVGTSSLRAGLLLEHGWSSVLPSTNIDDARRNARLHAAVDGGFACVLAQRVAADGRVGYHLCSADVDGGDTPRERLGFSESAGLADIISSILDAAHTHLRHAIDVGSGHKDLTIPSLKEIMQGHDVGMKHVRKIAKPLRSANKKALTTPGAPGSRKPRAPVMKRTARVARVPTAKKARRVKSAGAPGGKAGAPFGPNNPNPAGPRTASSDVRVRGTIGGKPSTTTIRSGTNYTLVSTPLGTILKRPGGHGVFIVHPADEKKL